MTEFGSCAACDHTRFSITITNATKLTMGPTGEVLDSLGFDLLTDVTCKHCGHVQLASEDMSDTTTNALLDHT